MRYTITTSNQPGAVGIVQVSGDTDAVVGVLNELTSKRKAHSRDLTGPGGAAHDNLMAQAVENAEPPPPGAVRPRLIQENKWEVGRLRLCDFAGIDEGLAGLISPTTAQLMPHGGPRVMQKLTAWLRDHGVRPEAEIDPVTRYPEAGSPIEADVLHAIATAASPAAIDRLAMQPALWRRWFRQPSRGEIPTPKSLGHLLNPPTVVVVGRPNVGKSTLLNQLLGRSASVVADLPGTTRDWVGGLVELTPTISGGGSGGESDALRDAVAVRWLDTPGLRESDDTVEQRAIAQAREVIAAADVLIAMRDAEIAWPETAELPRRPDLWVVNKVDRQNATAGAYAKTDSISISAAEGRGIDTLTGAVWATLGLDEFEAEALWAFSPTLAGWADSSDAVNEKAVQDYLHGPS